MTTDSIDNQTQVQFISYDQCAQQSITWQNLIHEENANLESLFLKDIDTHSESKYLQLGVKFDSSTMLSFLSTVGLDTINIRFGVDKSGKNFNVILYGTNNSMGSATPITPCLIGIPFYDNDPTLKLESLLPVDQNKLGAVPATIAVEWATAWSYNGRNKLTSSLFELPNIPGDNILRGYKYPMKEFVYDLFPTQGLYDLNKGAIYVHLVLHQYYPLDYTAQASTGGSLANTLGLTFLGVFTPISQSTNGSDSAVTISADITDGKSGISGYTDFSAPCPPTCGN